MSKERFLGIVILAAGASNRLGSPKQLLNFKNKTLLQRVVNISELVKCSLQILVLGSSSELILKKIKLNRVKVVINEGWEEGIASSIRSGLQKCLETYPTLQNVLFLVSDQPFLNLAIVERIIRTHQTKKSLVTASEYGEKIGVPAIFNKIYFENLLSLKGDQGAKKILLEFSNKVEHVPFNKGEIDIDTKRDCSKWLS